MKKIIFKYSLQSAIAWTIIIFILCSTPGQFIPTTSWLELLSFDKFVHASIFFMLTVLWLLYLYKINKQSVFVTVVIMLFCIVYGGLLEIMQATLFSNRSGDWLDFIANTFGCILALLIFTKFKLQLIR
jgi:VanZ family protein